MGFFGDMNRSYVGDFFLPCVVDALIGKKQHAYNDEQDPQPTGRFHFSRAFVVLDGLTRKTAAAKAIKTKVDADCHRLMRCLPRSGLELPKAA